jgi:hypothetical protein
LKFEAVEKAVKSAEAIVTCYVVLSCELS